MRELVITPAAIARREYRKNNWEKIREIEKRCYQNNKSKRSAYDKQRRSKNPEIHRAQAKDWKLKNPARAKASHLAWARKNKIKRAEYTLAWRKSNPHKTAAISQRTYLKNKERILERNEKWRIKNRESWLVKGRAYFQRSKERIKLRRHNSPTERTICNCRNRIRVILKAEGVRKSARTEEMIGCTADFMRRFIEHQLEPEMNWFKWGTYWELDHVIPISNFDVSDPIQLRQAFHYSNCKPITKVANRSKSDKLPPPHQALLL